MTKKNRIFLMGAMTVWVAFTLWVIAKGYFPF
jgi:hypothetical protein